jgi:N-acetylglucosamine-6-sulfatase
LGAAGAAPAVAQSAATRRRDNRPNIVFVITDDLRHDYLGCTGHPFARTPNIDRVAREGVTFTNFFTAVPLCSPSRACFLTGLYPHAHRIINNDKHGLAEISHTLLTFPRILRESGYETGFVGKWHMGFDDGRRPGFDHWVSFHAQGLYIDPVVNVNGDRRQLRGYMTDFLNDEAARFLNRPHPQPFCLFVAHKAVHYPYLPARRHDKLYESARYDPPQVRPEDLAGKPAMRLEMPPVDVLRMEGATPEPQESRRGRPETPDAVVRDQARCLASVDEGMGQILDALQRHGQLDNTIVIFTSDNGYLMGEHGQFDQKRWAYEESIRLPFVARYPKLIKPGSRREQMALSIDVAPTLLELAGVQPYSRMHGRSLLPVLRDGAAPLRDSLLVEHFVEKMVPTVPDWQAVRTDACKYIHYPTLKNMDELYDLKTDPHEIRNLASDAGYSEPLARMQTELSRHLRETDDPRLRLGFL